MLQHLLDSNSLLWMAEDLAEQVATLCVDDIVQLPLLEQPLQFAVVHILEALIAGIRCGERRKSRQQDEDQHAQRENVRLLAIESLIRVHFRRHIPLLSRSNGRRWEQCRAVAVRKSATQSKVADLDHVLLFVQQHVLERQV